MRLVSLLLNVATFSGISAIITLTIYFVNVWLLSSNKHLSPTDALFFEGILFIIVGFLLFLGRGGINRLSQRAAILSAAADALYKKGTIGPSEMYRRDKWKPEGFIRIALILMLTGVFMLLVYFLTL